MSNPSELKPDYAQRASRAFNAATVGMLASSVAATSLLISVAQNVPAGIAISGVALAFCSTFAAAATFNAIRYLKAATPEAVRNDIVRRETIPSELKLGTPG